VTTLPELEPFLTHRMRTVVFHEPIGFRGEQAGELTGQAEEWLDAAEALIDEAGAEHVRLGIAPHAPYSVSPALFRSMGALTARRGLPLSVHVSETEAELEFVRTGSGPFRGLLEERNAWDPSWTPPGVTPVRYLAELGLLNRPGLAVHANYLSADDVELLREGRQIPTWCPGSHRFFGHADHPAHLLHEAGISVALGTDSAASNLGLSMLREVRLAAEARPEVPREQWVEAATLTGARALGLGEETGSLEPGKAADLQVLEGQAESTPDPLAALFEQVLRVRMVLVNGEEMKIR
jgi:aminodeoxyfutalosine deaminase